MANLELQTVRIGRSTELLQASGSITVDGGHSTPILLPFSGQIARVMVEPGESVRPGQPLLTIASPDLVEARNSLLTSVAQEQSAVEAVRIAAQNAQRQKALFETAGGAQKDALQAQADLVTAQANLRAVQSSRRAAQDKLEIFGKSADEVRSLASPTRGLNSQSATIFRAPVAGTIAERNVAPGQYVGAGSTTPLMTIADLSRVWLVAQMSESDAGKVQLGDEVSVTTPAFPGRTFTARLDNIGAALDPATHRLPVRATVENPGGLLKPQMFANFTIKRPVGNGTGVLVPVTAIIHEGDSARVWVLTGDGLLHGRPVTTADSNAGMTRVTSGLRPGDRIVTSGALFVNEAGLDQ